jgi:hypothetical protein
VQGFYLVRKKGLEPPRREAPDPKSGAATNYATSAYPQQKELILSLNWTAKVKLFRELWK